MATFKVGQRVRVARAPDYAKPENLHRVGMEGRIIAIPSDNWRLECDVLLDGERDQAHPTGAFAAMFWWLEPMDPKADAFIEGLKKLAREPAPLERHAVGDKS
jgi:hypothetical protein